ncbi:tRNA-uridine aminocarboxypropyltransferase [Colwellia psychrerythraea]|uniref:tRNA-uridine aminocarboxypropyltransferase n=1 Tax=Colwellia psychrerythraea TaxID=28229 RepID=A0A099L4K6_COLPS|nr:DTW domain-containing protein [Colwellia psychrerythraea]KGJ97062.1 DTW domain containing protein [Colwellia psychrerythraea]
MHAVHKLHQYRKSISTTTYKARGQRVIRCELCQLAKQFCICELAPSKEQVETTAGFLLLYYDTEVMKPSNTGKLIADLIPDTFAFLWSRTQDNPELLTVLNDEKWFPLVVFPQEYAGDEREVFTNKVTCPEGKRPLFIMLDGSWREAKKMFRKSPYLDGFPMVSFDAKTAIQAITGNYQGDNNNQLSPVGQDSRYTVRKTELEHQFSTAEVAARVLDMHGEVNNAHVLDLWFDVFNFQYQKSVCQRNKGNVNAIENYQSFLSQTYR